MSCKKFDNMDRNLHNTDFLTVDLLHIIVHSENSYMSQQIILDIEKIGITFKTNIWITIK